MSDTNETFFKPEEIDEQIERVLSDQPAKPSEEAARRAISGLQRIYALNSPAHDPSLQRVWQRILDAEAQENAGEQQEETAQGLGQRPQLDRASGERRRATKRSRLLLTQLVAILCLVLIVGSFVWFINRPGPIQPVSRTITNSSGNLYAYLGQTLYRVDNQSHNIIWKYTFASNEAIEDNSSIPQLRQHQSFSVGNILYVMTHDTKDANQQYLYAFSQNSGTLLWKLSSARPLTNNQTLYTLVESRTSDVSTLMARNPQTGQQLWQRQYPIIGSKKDPGYGTDNTEGFRLVAASEEVLYAVRSYHQNGQDFFARYALSAKDGSIIWQNSQPVVGSISDIEAQIVNGVIYTTEYYLKSITPYTDKNGMTVSEIPQSQVVAYEATTGKRLWQTPEGIGEEPNPDFSLSVTGTLLYYQVYNQNLLVTNSQSPTPVFTLYALRLTDGAPQWRYQVKDTNITASTMDDNNLYVETSHLNGGQLALNIVALDQQNGTLRWTTPVKFMDDSKPTPTPTVKSSPSKPIGSMPIGISVDMAPVVSHGIVYYSRPGNSVYALQASDGKILTLFSIDKTNDTTLYSRLFFFALP
ncbi:outer membrane protein assembly factor BamB family protein [Dictyobacter kobayashii]|uniref:Pyrrolo-quinoline quinone repeat domain-containing protein n=1 Tax=Dictyobacter kobayashii TaxID=2014872 RepID=A0A402ARP3_9CHLR|nr:PQQ-binding-like beta-propeller repeat protein [Dictyobacter kobayashii]GCE21770.1 hypothetical protein KDK_55700 [Dictyobacter kobayashii]